MEETIAEGDQAVAAKAGATVKGDEKVKEEKDNHAVVAKAEATAKEDEKVTEEKDSQASAAKAETTAKGDEKVKEKKEEEGQKKDTSSGKLKFVAASGKALRKNLRPISCTVMIRKFLANIAREKPEEGGEGEGQEEEKEFKLSQNANYALTQALHAYIANVGIAAGKVCVQNGRKQVELEDVAIALGDMGLEAGYVQQLVIMSQMDKVAAQNLRDITIKDIMSLGFMEEGQGVISITLQGKEVKADLDSNGNIVLDGKAYSSPSRFGQASLESVGSTKRYAGGWEPIQYKGKSILTIRAAADALLTKEEEEKEREQEKMTSLKRKSPAGDVEPQTVDKKKKV